METDMDFREYFLTDAFEDVRENPHIKYNTQYLYVCGSHAYGFADRDSDVDIRGFATPTREDMLTVTDFDHLVRSDVDVQIYSMHKFLHLLCKGNPNGIEGLFMPENMVIYKSPVADMLIDKRDMFLTKTLARAFCGFAVSSKRKLIVKGFTDLRQVRKCLRNFYRCMRCAIEILNGEGVKVYRDDHDEIVNLMGDSIDVTDDGFRVSDRFFNEISDEMDREYYDAVNASKLPDVADRCSVRDLEIAMAELAMETSGDLSITELVAGSLS